MVRKRQDRRSPLYMISVVSRMLEVHPQTLRMYEREGFICPHRVNRQRLYSDEDLDRLNLVIRLTKDLGVNKAGVDIILRMRRQLAEMQEHMSDMLRYLDDDVRANLRKNKDFSFSEL